MRSGCGASRAGCQCRQRREQLLETLCRLELVPTGVAGGFFTGSPHRPSAGRPRCSRPSPGSGSPSPPEARRSWKSLQVPGEGPLRAPRYSGCPSGVLSGNGPVPGRDDGSRPGVRTPCVHSLRAHLGVCMAGTEASLPGMRTSRCPARGCPRGLSRRRTWPPARPVADRGSFGMALVPRPVYSIRT